MKKGREGGRERGRKCFRGEKGGRGMDGWMGGRRGKVHAAALYTHAHALSSSRLGIGVLGVAAV